VPAAVVVNDTDEYVPLPLTVAVEVNSGDPAQVGSPGANPSNVMVPDGTLKPLARVAVSDIAPPTAVGPDGVVARVGVARETVEDSLAAPHGMITEELLASPL
jgi:hypothetical protein